MLIGTCLCGEAGFEVHGELTDVSFCHCSRCRKTTGSAFAAYGSTPESSFRWVRGREHLAEHAVSPELTKWFYSRCWTTLLTHHTAEPDRYHVSLGCLADGPALVPEYHQFVGSKAPWHRIDDNLPRHDAWPDER